MVIFITVAEVDQLLGTTWAADDKKASSVLMANAWLGGLGLRLQFDPHTQQYIIPDDVKLAGAYAALAASQGKLYEQKTTGSMTSKSVKADSVEVSRTFSELNSNSISSLDANLQLALALLRPYGYSFNQVRVQRG